MPLEVQGPRQLSPLEDEVVTFVFERNPPPGVERTIIVQDILLEIVDDIPVLGKVVSTYRNGLITINRSALPHTQALNQNSTRTRVYPSDGTFQRTDLFSPGNLHYLSTLIHGCAHHWQEKYDLFTDPGHKWDPPYDFSQEQLKNLDLFSEQHASAAQIYFLIEWQLRYRRSPGNGKKYLDLTSQSWDRSKNVGPVDRYTRMLDDEKFKHENGERLLNLKDALCLNSDFNAYSFNLVDRGERTPCKESTLVARNLEGRFFEPIVQGIVGIGSRPCEEDDGLV